jgi:hypothetical protein
VWYRSSDSNENVDTARYFPGINSIMYAHDQYVKRVNDQQFKGLWDQVNQNYH